MRVASFARPDGGAAQAASSCSTRAAREARIRGAARRRRRRRDRSRRPRPGRGVARPRRVPDGARRRRSPRSSARCRPRCWRRCSSTTRSTCRSCAGGTVDALRGGHRTATAPTRREIVRGMERVVVARLRDAAFFFARGPQAPAGRPRGRTWPASPSTASLGPTRTRRSGWRGSSTPWASVGLLDAGRAAGRARGGAAGQGRPHHADGPRVPGAAGRDGRDLPARGRARRATWRARCAGTTTRSRSRRAPRPRDVFAGDATPRVFARGLARRQARHAGRLLRPRAGADRQQRSVRPAPRGAGRGPRAARLLARGGRSARPSLRTLVAAGRRRLRRRAQEAAGRTSSATSRRFLLDRLRYVLVAARLRRRTRSRRCWARASRTPSTIRTRRCCACARCTACARRPREDFEHLAVAFKRAKNILGRGSRRPPSTRRCSSEDAERELHEAVARPRAASTAATRRGCARWPACARPSTASSTTCW